MRIEPQAMRVAVNSRTVGSRSSNHIIPNPARSRIARRDTLRTLKGKDTEFGGSTGTTHEQQPAPYA
jgi:hypothetical protein